VGALPRPGRGKRSDGPPLPYSPGGRRADARAVSAEEAQALRARAAKCRRLARGIDSRDVERSLRALADEYERGADEMDPPRAAGPAPEPPNPS